MQSPEIELGSRKAGPSHPPLVIAEIGANHDGSLDRGKWLIEAAADAGADAVKFQLFHPEDLCPPDHPGYETAKAVALPRSWLPILRACAEDNGVEFLASAFCPDCVRALDDEGVVAHKVASSEVTNLSLLLLMARSGRPILLSTGMSQLSDVARAVETCEMAGNTALAVLQCTALYPTPPEQANLLLIPRMLEVFDHVVGFSDHTLGINVSSAAVALGASILEKHFTFDREASGPDHSFALEPGELRALCAAVDESYRARGSHRKEFLTDERRDTRRPGLYTDRRIPAGARITQDAINIRRPAVGIEREFLDAVIGTRATVDLGADEPIRWEHLDPTTEGDGGTP